MKASDSNNQFLLQTVDEELPGDNLTLSDNLRLANNLAR
jgi:hypothetical protein